MQLPQNNPLKERMIESMRQKPARLSSTQRDFVDEAIREVCSHREYLLYALNIRSNHVHAVISKSLDPEKIVNDLKAYSTRRLRLEGTIPANSKVWSRGASTRYLWKPRHLEAAVDYVLFSQGDDPFGTIYEVQ